jgi:hypothetical protein
MKMEYVKELLEKNKVELERKIQQLGFEVEQAKFELSYKSESLTRTIELLDQVNKELKGR